MAFNYTSYYSDWRKNHAIPQSERRNVAYEEAMSITGLSRNYQTTAYALARVVAFRFKVSPILPYDTGNFMKNGIVAKPKNKNTAMVRFGNAHVPYAYHLQFDHKTSGGNPNRHEGFVEKILEGGLLDELQMLVATKGNRALVAPRIADGYNTLYLGSKGE